MLESVQSSTNQQSSQYWSLFAKSGDPQMYLKYRQGKSGKNSQNMKREFHENN